MKEPAIMANAAPTQIALGSSLRSTAAPEFITPLPSDVGTTVWVTVISVVIIAVTVNAPSVVMVTAFVDSDAGPAATTDVYPFSEQYAYM
jgi:hypothetical protein